MTRIKKVAKRLLLAVALATATTPSVAAPMAAESTVQVEESAKRKPAWLKKRKRRSRGICRMPWNRTGNHRGAWRR